MDTNRLVLVARLKPGGRDRVRELIAAGPDPEIAATFDRVGVFLTEDEVVFYNEGERADESMRAFFDDPVRSTALTPWLAVFDGPLRRAREAYFVDRGG